SAGPWQRKERRANVFCSRAVILIGDSGGKVVIEKIDHVMMWASDLDAVAAWYRNKLGFSVSYHAPGEFLSLQHPSMGRLDFHAAGADKSNIGHGPMPYYVVRDIHGVKAWLEEKGIKVQPV